MPSMEDIADELTVWSKLVIESVMIHTESFPMKSRCIASVDICIASSKEDGRTMKTLEFMLYNVSNFS
ncbi:hypothetical protein AQUCO_00500112v1 [Aquilegia coerulea]|uniref:Uncharacterized protein n=1 Tax=Aquilegia coerulea TaxID=218851 RepID=A0A2G5EQD2_AQUCA|nr:hypothetical protein AQUCO_00500112v1 [Aquilegia coerulea]